MPLGMTIRSVPELSSGAVVHLLAARALRDFGDGFAAILLPVYLLELGFSPLEIGVLATAALLGSALLTFGIGLIGSRHDRQRLLLAGAMLMIATGVAYAVVHDFALLLVVALAGTINPSAGSVSIFVPLEHAVLSDEASDQSRTRLFARYSLIGALSAAFGALAAASPQFLAAAGLDELTAIKAMFVLYAALGVAGCLLYSRIPRQPPIASGGTDRALGPSRHIVYRLAALFSLDAFAGGFVVQSLLALWLFERFDLSLSAASLFFFWSGVLSAFSFPVAAWISSRVGLINTMVFTHIPVEHLPDAGRLRTVTHPGAGAAARACRPLPNGCSDAVILCHGRGHPGGAARRCQLHVGAAQPCRGRKSRDCRRALRRFVSGAAAVDLRHAQDHLRPAASQAIPEP